MDCGWKTAEQSWQFSDSALQVKLKNSDNVFASRLKKNFEAGIGGRFGIYKITAARVNF